MSRSGKHRMSRQASFTSEMRSYRSAFGIIVLLTSLLVGLLLTTRAEAVECTNSWTGPTSGLWGEAENWSAEAVPTASDVVCIPTATSVALVEESGVSGALQIEGTLTVEEGSLTLSTTNVSEVESLELWDGELVVPGELSIIASLDATEGAISGGGKTQIGDEAVGIIDGTGAEGDGVTVSGGQQLIVIGEMKLEGSDPTLLLEKESELKVTGLLLSAGTGDRLTFLDDSSLINNGTVELTGTGVELLLDDESAIDNASEFRLSDPEGQITLDRDATIDNSGTLDLNGLGVELGPNAEAVNLVNTGSLRKMAGEYQTEVAIPVENEGLTEAQAGRFVFSGGGNSGNTGPDGWNGAGGQVALAGGTFALGPVAEVAGSISMEAGAVVTAGRIAGAGASVAVAGSSLALTNSEASSNIGEVTAGSSASISFAGDIAGGAAFLFGGNITVASGKNVAFSFVNDVSGTVDFGSNTNITVSTALVNGSMNFGEGVVTNIPFFYVNGGSASFGDGGELEFGNAYAVSGRHLDGRERN